MATVSPDGIQSVLYHNEAEAYVESLIPFQIRDIGTEKWEHQREHVEKLNIQAVVDATNNVEESIKELFLTHEKIPILINELVTLDLWKRHVLPLVLKMEFSSQTSFPAYVTMFYESILVGLLEVLLFHGECHEAAGDALHDLLQYCQQKLIWLMGSGDGDQDNWYEIGRENPEINDSPAEEIIRRHKKISFDVAMKCIAIVRYIGEYSKDVSLGVTTRLLNTHDFPAIFATLMDNPPWRVPAKDPGMWYKYDGKSWAQVSNASVTEMNKMEGQVWLGLLTFLMSEHCQTSYQLNSSNQAAILKLRSHFNPTIINQLPVLVDLQRYLEELSIMSVPASRPPLILEQLPELYTCHETKCSGKWAAIAEAHFRSIFCMSSDRLRKQAEKFIATYDMDVMADLMAEPPRCENCGELAAKRCSSCATSWYCGRECQVKHWSKHKSACKTLSEALNQKSSS